MIYYIHLNEKSKGSGADFPHFDLERINFEETMKILSLDFSIGRSHFSLPKVILPMIITNDSYLCTKFREVYSLEELMKWCQLPLDQKADRDYFVDAKHYHFRSIEPIGKEIIAKVNELIQNKISYANMKKGISDDSFTDEYGQTFYSERRYDDGWETLNFKKENTCEEENLYNWWLSLDKVWQNILLDKSYYDKPDDNFIPSFELLKNIINKKKLRIIGSFISIHNILIKIFDELDIEPLKNLKNLEELEFQSINHIENIDILKKMSGLKVLKFPNTKISSLDFIESLEELEELDISQTDITDILRLYSLKNLKKLNCNFTNLDRLTPIQNLEELQLIGTNFNQTDIENYEKLLGYKIKNIIQ